MPKKCIKFISGFLIPSLDKETFGKYLRWIDKSRSMFQIDWSHRKASSWTEQGGEIFIEWDKHKGHYQPNDKDYVTRSKQRFRSMLYKFKLTGQLKELEYGDKYKKVFCIVKRDKKRRKSDVFMAELELYNEGVLSSDDKEEEQDDDDNEDDADDDNDDDDNDILPDDIYRREISKHNTINILADHTYSSNLQDDDTDYEDNEKAQDNFIAMIGSRVLVEKNSMLQEHSISIPNNMNEMQAPWDLLLNENEDFNFETENINTSRFSAEYNY